MEKVAAFATHDRFIDATILITLRVNHAGTVYIELLANHIPVRMRDWVDPPHATLRVTSPEFTLFDHTDHVTFAVMNQLIRRYGFAVDTGVVPFMVTTSDIGL